MNFIIIIMYGGGGGGGGGKVSIILKSQLSKIYRFLVWVWLYTML